MSNILMFSLLFFPFTKAIGQESFEGTLTYKVEHNLKPQEFGNVMMTGPEIIKRMKSNGDYYDQVVVKIKDGNYIKTENSRVGKKSLYNSSTNNVYTTQNDEEYVIIMDANRTNAFGSSKTPPTFVIMDNSVVINGIDCKVLKVTHSSKIQELYYFNSDKFKINPSLFSKHNYEYLNQILNYTQSYPIQIERIITPTTTIKMTLSNSKEEKLSDALFAVPKMTDAEPEYADLMQKLTGMVVKKIVK